MDGIILCACKEGKGEDDGRARGESAHVGGRDYILFGTQERGEKEMGKGGGMRVTLHMGDRRRKEKGGEEETGV